MNTMKKQIHIFLVSFVAVFVCGFVSRVAFAQCATNPDLQACSSNQYGVGEVFFGTGGELEACSTGGTGYCSKQAAGELTVGNTKSNTLQAQAGFNTDRTPWLEVAVSKWAVDLGTVTTTATGFDYASFTVKSYLASGYVVQVYGPTPTYGSHVITPLVTTTASSPGTEQFGLNLRDNSSPNVGVEPVQRPDNTFSFGTYENGYDTVNAFKYVSGGIIAQSASSSGYTDYTISYMMNVSEVTPAGTYTANQSIVVTSTF